MALANTICPDSPRLSSKTASDQARSLILQALDLITEGTLETADLYLQKASKLAPKNPDLQFALGLFHEESGDAAQAQHQVQGGRLRRHRVARGPGTVIHPHSDVDQPPLLQQDLVVLGHSDVDAGLRQYCLSAQSVGVVRLA